MAELLERICCKIESIVGDDDVADLEHVHYSSKFYSCVGLRVCDGMMRKRLTVLLDTT